MTELKMKGKIPARGTFVHDCVDMRRLSVNFPTALLERVTNMAVENNVAASEMVRRLVEKGLRT